MSPLTLVGSVGAAAVPLFAVVPEQPVTANSSAAATNTADRFLICHLPGGLNRLSVEVNGPPGPVRGRYAVPHQVVKHSGQRCNPFVTRATRCWPASP